MERVKLKKKLYIIEIEKVIKYLFYKNMFANFVLIEIELLQKSAKNVYSIGTLRLSSSTTLSSLKVN